jgi:hypothetical protein
VRQTPGRFVRRYRHLHLRARRKRRGRCLRAGRGGNRCSGGGSADNAEAEAGADIFRAPLSPRELARYDAVVLDPPRSGAKAQAEALAASKVPKVVMVSCNPGTCARDLRILVDGGYRIARVVPVDQFLFSPHIELVAELER